MQSVKANIDLQGGKIVGLGPLDTDCQHRSTD